MRQHPDEERNRVSHETIYRSLYVQTRGVLKKELQNCLRTPRAIRRSQHATQKGLKLRRIKDAIPISARPPEIEDRAVPGHWEGDLIVGANNSYIATLVKRYSRFVMLAKVPNKDTQSVITALIKQAGKLPKKLYRSLTWDRGSEMTDHVTFTMATRVDVFFCDPQSPWQRGSNENTNRLLRQYFPRGLDMSTYSQAKQRGCQTVERTNQKDLAIPNPSRKVRAVCCGDPLNPQGLCGHSRYRCARRA